MIESSLIAGEMMNVFEIAEYLFGPMRSSTEEENKLIRDMMRRNSKPFGVNLFEMDEVEMVDSEENDDDDQRLLP